MTLKEACSVVFKDAITVASLKAEAARGNLTMRKVGRAYFVTLNDLSAMWEKCRVMPERQCLVQESVRDSSLAALDLLLKQRGTSARTTLRAELDARTKRRKNR